MNLPTQLILQFGCFILNFTIEFWNLTSFQNFILKYINFIHVLLQFLNISLTSALFSLANDDCVLLYSFVFSLLVVQISTQMEVIVVLTNNPGLWCLKRQFVFICPEFFSSPNVLNVVKDRWVCLFGLTINIYPFTYEKYNFWWSNQNISNSIYNLFFLARSTI